jgi:signal transduction histidine kinase
MFGARASGPLWILAIASGLGSGLDLPDALTPQAARMAARRILRAGRSARFSILFAGDHRAKPRCIVYTRVMRLTLTHRPLWGVAVCSLPLLGAVAVGAKAGAQTPGTGGPLDATNVLQLRQLASPAPVASHPLQLEADVWWANPAQGRLVLHDDSGSAVVELDLQGQPIRSGDRVRLEGSAALLSRAAVIRLGSFGPLVENDGIHSANEIAGAVYLSAGRHPIRLDWFNGTGRFGLNVDYEGPGVSRQRIPNAVLWRQETHAPAGAGPFVPGVDYQYYEGGWTTLPEFGRLTPVKTGRAANFDLAGRTRDNHVALQFNGYLETATAGLYRFYVSSDDGSRLFVGEPTVQSRVVGQSGLPTPRHMIIGQVLPEDALDGVWAEVQGEVAFIERQPEGLHLELRAGAGCMRVEVVGDAGVSTAELLRRRIRAVGFCQGAFSLDGERVAGTLLVPGGNGITLLEPAATGEANAAPDTNPPALPLLTTAGAVRALKPQEARRGYPLRIRGVITCVQPDHRAFVIQDSTRGLYVSNPAPGELDLPRVGDFVEITGKTDEPGIAKLQQCEPLGQGTLPEPVHPAWDQLMNGSLDSQWIEIGGLVENLIDRTNGWWRVMLRTRAGTLKVDVRKAGVKPAPLEQYENAVVRLRGCMFADWLPNMRLKVGQIRMYDADFNVDQPAPTDLFSVPRTTAAALMQFDPTFDGSRRVKVAGQVVYARGADYFTMDGKDGFRFQARQPLGLEAGDLVEAVGYPELSGAAPVLRGAVARKTGHAPLPKPRPLAPNDLIRANLDATRVRVEGLLTGLKQTRTNVVLEMQAGPWRFLGRLNRIETASTLQLGSRLELTGVYCAQGGYASLGTDFAPLDLFINQAADIRVLSQPPWWTLRRLLVIVGVLACVVAVMILWITQLRRQVEERSAELETQIEHRQQVEHQRFMEQERARIARDLHDQLGSDIATVSMLATRAQLSSVSEEKRNQHLDQVRGKAREMVAGLDEIVWAMNPVHDSLSSLESYLGRYAGRFLGLANIAWRFQAPPGTVNCPVDSRQRYQLFLAYKEALTNIVRHSAASEVQMDLQVQDHTLLLTVADNGRGLPDNPADRDKNGMGNMRERIEKLGGRFEILSRPGNGTTVTFAVPLK